MKKFAGDIIILYMCTKNHNIWCTVAEIRSETYIFCHFEQFFALLLTIIRSMVPETWSVTDTNFGQFRPFFAILPSINQKNQNFEKMKKTSGDITILHLCTINDNHMMYGSWDIERDGQNFLSFWNILCPFTPLTT